MKLRTFWLHFNRLDAMRGAPDVWDLIVFLPGNRRRHILASKVDLRVPTTTIFRGQHAPQPRAFMRGVGRIRVHGRKVVIEGAC